jgi:hypothetical protein
MDGELLVYTVCSFGEAACSLELEECLVVDGGCMAFWTVGPCHSLVMTFIHLICFHLNRHVI